MIERVLDRLTRLHPKVIDLSLGRVERLLARLGAPQRALPPVVHVAGTNGKGSTIATLRAILEAAGRRVHVYTSPHLVRFNERIRVAGAEIDDPSLLALLEEVEAVNAGEPITFFEATTAAAFLAFARAPADMVLLETGLGGRLDATNVVERPALTVLAPIDLDHQQFLGEDLVAIAAEKAGILKAGSPCLSARQHPDALAVIAGRAVALGCELMVEGRDFAADWDGDGLVYRHGAVRRALPAPALAGAHQSGNAALAIAAAERLLPGLDDATIAQGLNRVRWPARLQRLTHGPLVEALPPQWELWLDGGHNPHAALAIAAHAARSWGDRPLLAVFGMLSTKDVDGYLAPMAPHLAALAAVPIPGEHQALSAEDAAAAARRHGIPADIVPDPAAALARWRDRQPGPARILICGSLYLAGTVLAENG